MSHAPPRFLFVTLASALYVLCSLSLFSVPWPAESVLTEFASQSSQLQREHPTPFIALSSSEEYTAPAGSLLFRGRIANGLGNVEVREGENGMWFLLGNLEQPEDFNTGRDMGDNDLPVQVRTETLEGFASVNKPLLIMTFDVQLSRIINPELVFENPAGNQPPSLIRLRFFCPE